MCLTTWIKYILCILSPEFLKYVSDNWIKAAINKPKSQSYQAYAVELTQCSLGGKTRFLRQLFLFLYHCVHASAKFLVINISALSHLHSYHNLGHCVKEP